MNKNEYGLQQLVIRSENLSQWLGLVRRLLTLAAGVACVWIIMKGLEGIVQQNPASLNALASVIEKLNISGILSYVLAGGASIGYVFEKNGKRRAYKELGDMRARIENKDAYHPSSTLDRSGQSPK